MLESTTKVGPTPGGERQLVYLHVYSGGCVTAREAKSLVGPAEFTDLDRKWRCSPQRPQVSTRRLCWAREAKTVPNMNISAALNIWEEIPAVEVGQTVKCVAVKYGNKRFTQHFFCFVFSLSGAQAAASVCVTVWTRTDFREKWSNN